MYLVAFKTDGVDYWVFLKDDPRPACLPLQVIENVTYSRPGEIFGWLAHSLFSDVTFGRSKTQPKSFKLFPTRRALADAGFEPLDGYPWVHPNWGAFLNSVQGRFAARQGQKERRGDGKGLSTGQ